MSPSVPDATTVMVGGHRHRWSTTIRQDPDGPTRLTFCDNCGRQRDEARSRRGATVRSYGTRAELKAARTYGGVKVGHHGGPVDVQGAEWETQVKTHRRNPPAEWTKAFAALPGDRLPRLLLRFVRPGLPPVDFFVVPGKAWLDWWGRDSEDEAP